MNRDHRKKNNMPFAIRKQPTWMSLRYSLNKSFGLNKINGRKQPEHKRNEWSDSSRISADVLLRVFERFDTDQIRSPYSPRQKLTASRSFNSFEISNDLWMISQVFTVVESLKRVIRIVRNSNSLPFRWLSYQFNQRGTGCALSLSLSRCAEGVGGSKDSKSTEFCGIF